MNHSNSFRHWKRACTATQMVMEGIVNRNVETAYEDFMVDLFTMANLPETKFVWCVTPDSSRLLPLNSGFNPDYLGAVTNDVIDPMRYFIIDPMHNLFIEVDAAEAMTRLSQPPVDLMKCTSPDALVREVSSTLDKLSGSDLVSVSDIETGPAGWGHWMKRFDKQSNYFMSDFLAAAIHRLQTF